MVERNENGVSYKVKELILEESNIHGIILLEYLGDPVNFRIGLAKFEDEEEGKTEWKYYMELLNAYYGWFLILEPEEYALSVLTDIEKAKESAYSALMNWSH